MLLPRVAVSHATRTLSTGPLQCATEKIRQLGLPTRPEPLARVKASNLNENSAPHSAVSKRSGRKTFVNIEYEPCANCLSMVSALTAHLVVGVAVVLFTTALIEKSPKKEEPKMAWRRISTQFIAVRQSHMLFLIDLSD